MASLYLLLDIAILSMILIQSLAIYQSQIPDDATIIFYSVQSFSLNITNQIAMIDIDDRIYIAFDIKFVSLKHTNSKQQILKIGNGNNENLANIFLIQSTLQFDNINMMNSSLILNVWYNVSLYKTQNTLKYWINKQIIYENNSYPSHQLLTNRSVYIGDNPSIHHLNDIILKNLYIWTAPKQCMHQSKNIKSKTLISIGVICGFVVCLIIATIIIILYYRKISKEEENIENHLESINVNKQNQERQHMVTIQKNASEQSTQTDRRYSVEFEDIYNISNGAPIPAYISSNDESESSTFTASSSTLK